MLIKRFYCTPIQIAKLHRGRRYQILPAYTQDGILLSRVFQGTTEGDIFEDFIEQLLPHYGRWPEPKSVIVMDNASFHRTERFPQYTDNKINKSLDPGYLLILRSPGDEKENALAIPDSDFNPFRDEGIVLAIENRGRRQYGDTEFEMTRRAKKMHRLSPSPSWSRERETARRVTRDEEDVRLSQKEAETAVNDFLASFSSLYDDVPPGERTKVLDSAPIVEEEGGEESEEEEDIRKTHSMKSSSLSDD